MYGGPQFRGCRSPWKSVRSHSAREIDRHDQTILEPSADTLRQRALKFWTSKAEPGRRGRTGSNLAPSVLLHHSVIHRPNSLWPDGLCECFHNHKGDALVLNHVAGPNSILTTTRLGSDLRGEGTLKRVSAIVLRVLRRHNLLSNRHLCRRHTPRAQLVIPSVRSERAPPDALLLRGGLLHYSVNDGKKVLVQDKSDEYEPSGIES